jgi:hypothetical protein
VQLFELSINRTHATNYKLEIILSVKHKQNV